MVRIIRTIAGVLAGIILISVLVEGIEFGLVALLHGEKTTDPDLYYSIRNQTWSLALKLVYNTLAAIIGGFGTALIAGYEHRKHGIALAILQTLSFGYALTQPEISKWTPAWMWFSLIFLSFVGIIFGSHIQSRRQASNKGKLSETIIAFPLSKEL